MTAREAFTEVRGVMATDIKCGVSALGQLLEGSDQLKRSVLGAGKCETVSRSNVNGQVVVLKYRAPVIDEREHINLASFSRLTVVQLKNSWCYYHQKCMICAAEGGDTLRTIHIMHDTLESEEAGAVIGYYSTLSNASVCSKVYMLHDDNSENLLQLLTVLSDHAVGGVLEIVMVVCATCVTSHLTPLTKKYKQTPKPESRDIIRDYKFVCGVRAVHQHHMGNNIVGNVRGCASCTCVGIPDNKTHYTLYGNSVGWVKISSSTDTAHGKVAKLEIAPGTLCRRHEFCFDCGRQAVGVMVSTIRGTQAKLIWTDIPPDTVNTHPICEHCFRIRWDAIKTAHAKRRCTNFKKKLGKMTKVASVTHGMV